MFVAVEMRAVHDWAAAIEQFAEFARVERHTWRRRLHVGIAAYAVGAAWTIVGACGIGFNLDSPYIIAINGALCMFAMWHVHHAYMQVLASKTMLLRIPMMYRQGLQQMRQQRKQALAVTPSTAEGAAGCP